MTFRPVPMPDLVCGTEVHPSAAAVTWDDADERYYFCSTECRRAFVAQLGDLLESYPA